MKVSKAVSIPTALYPENIEYVERVGEGDNFSKKIRSIINQHRDSREGIVKYDTDGKILSHEKEAVLAFEQTENAKEWVDKIPFPFVKSEGWQKLLRAAAENGFRSQVYERKEIGYIAVWLAPAIKQGTACRECRKNLLVSIENLLSSTKG